jgi:hypothetical protein
MPEFEVHEHSRIVGGSGKVKHSHEDATAAHPQHGPAHFTIDRDEWRRTTGLKGGGRKKFTKRPTGVQL